MDSSDWIRRAVLERELADIESRLGSYATLKEVAKYRYVCQWLRDELLMDSD